MRTRATLGVALVPLLAITAAAAGAQSSYPAISARQYVSGSAKVTVTGSFSYTAEIPINTQASMSDGEMTWLQFGAAGSASPNALLTFGNNEVGVSASRGKAIATASYIARVKSDCSGKAQVTATMVSGQYTCRGVTSYDPATGKMGMVNIDVQFSAGS